MPKDPLPIPPIPPDADLRDFGYLPLHTQQLRDSGLAIHADDKEFRAVDHAFVRVVAPNPPPDLFQKMKENSRFLSGFGREDASVRAWKKVGKEKLRGWEEYSDGRLYNAVFSGHVLTSLDLQRKNKDRTKAATEARQRKRDVERDVERDVDQGRGVEGRGVEGRGVEGRGNTTGGRVATRLAHNANGAMDFELFKAAYPKRAGGQPWDRAMRAANARVKEGHAFEELIEGARRYHRFCESTNQDRGRSS